MNKKIYCLLFMTLMLLSGASFAQKTIGETTTVKARTLPFESPELQARQEMDTILPPAFFDECSNTILSFFSNEWGFVGGMNNFGDLEKAQLINTSVSGMVTITEAWGFFDVAEVVGDGNLRMKIYETADPGDGPQNLLGQSDDLSVSSLQVDPQQILVTIFPFSEPVALSDSLFFLSCDFSDLYASQDTVSLLMTDDGCGSGDIAWELFDDGQTWVPISDTDFSWGLNSNWFVAAVYEFDAAASVNDPFVLQNGVRMSPAMPNPAQDWLELPYELQALRQVTLEIYAADGRRLRQIKKGPQLAGSYRERVDVSQLPDGIYVYGIVTEGTRLMSKFTIQR